MDDWARQRRHAIDIHTAAQRRREQDEAARAGKLVADFALAASERGIPDVPLAARAFNGRSRYRTGLRGWYLKPDESIAVGTDGLFYILAVPPSLRARLAGATLAPSVPPLTIGEGARDGESLPLATLLRMRLDDPL